jgi:hypothetical protein
MEPVIMNFKQIARASSLMLLAFFASSIAYAGQITAAPYTATEAPNSPFTITISMTTEKNSVNVVQGSIDIPIGVVVESATTAGSAFTIWPTLPAYDAASRQVQFAGGIPHGIPAGTTVKLFTIQAHAANTGTYVFKPDAIQAFQNDGKGTAEPVTVSSATITVKAGATATPIVASGAAQPLVATLGQDPETNGGKYFISIEGGDRGAGISGYEVQEGSGPFMAASTTYILPDQNLSEDITVHALDANGISAQTVLKATRSSGHSFGWNVLAAIIALIVIVGGVIRLRKKKPE